MFSLMFASCQAFTTKILTDRSGIMASVPAGLQRLHAVPYVRSISLSGVWTCCRTGFGDQRTELLRFLHVKTRLNHSLSVLCLVFSVSVSSCVFSRGWLIISNWCDTIWYDTTAILTWAQKLTGNILSLPKVSKKREKKKKETKI